MNKKELAALLKKRTSLVNSIADGLEAKVQENERKLLREVIEGFVDNLDRKDGKIENNNRNRRLIATIDNIFNDFSEKYGIAVSSGIVTGVQELFDFNKGYFSALGESKTKLVPINNEVKSTLEGWLGLSDKGDIQRNGYLDNLISDSTAKNSIKDLLVRSVISGSGLTETRAATKQMIVGDEKNLGVLQKHYRNLVYDTFSQVDRTIQKITADKLNLQFAIYEGGLIETSRKFCIDKNGKVFTRKEIEAFDPTEAKQPNYNPFTDLGGYGCRHHLNWIPKALAILLRPDLANAA